VPWDFALLGRTRAWPWGCAPWAARVAVVEPPSLKKSLYRLRRPHDAPDDLLVLPDAPSVPRISDRLPLLPRLHDAARAPG
jgi:hypothetical protein